MIVEPTFAGWLSAARDIAAPAAGLWSSLPDERVSSHGVEGDRLEAFARPLMLNAIVAASGDCAAKEIAERELSEFLLRPQRKGETRTLDSVAPSAALPEATSISLALWFGGHLLWRSLDRWQQADVAGWLRNCALQAFGRKNNWVLFGWTISRFLRSVGHSDPELTLLEQWCDRRVDGWYAGEGWYSDGGRRTFDYYNSFAFHYYPNVVAYLEGAGPSEEQVRRLGAYLDDLGRLIGPSGGPVRFGRSLTYRFGVGAPFSVAALVPKAPWEQAPNRLLLTRTINYFASREDLLSPQGVGPGWAGQTRGVTQSYSGPLASYWFAKAFVALLAGPDAPYWSDELATAPRRDNSSVVAPVPGFMYLKDDAGQSCLVNHGSYNRTTTDLEFVSEDPFYGRVLYSDRTWPDSVEGDLLGGVSVRSGAKVWARSRPIRVHTDSGRIRSVWTLRRLSGPARGDRDLFARVVAAVRRRMYKLELVTRLVPKVVVTTDERDDWLAFEIKASRLSFGAQEIRFGIPAAFIGERVDNWICLREGRALPARQVGDMFGEPFVVLASDTKHLAFSLRIRLNDSVYSDPPASRCS